jgi:hypothetical protein
MTIQTRTLVTVNGQSVWATREQADTLAMLEQTRKGGFARVYGYKATSGRVKPTVYDATVTTRFSYAKLLERKRNVLNAMTLDDVRPFVKAPKLLAMDDAALLATFNARKAKELNSIATTEAGNRTDAHRAAHDRCYMNVDAGIVVHYVTAKGDDGLMHPTLLDGFPIVDSIMLNVLEVSRTVREAGEYKVVNSGVDVLMSKAIEAAMKAKGVRSLSRLSLKEDNFERLAVDGNVVLPEDCVGLMA